MIANMGITDCTVIIVIPDDKDYAGVVRSMSEVATDIILTKSQNPHYVFTSKQSDKMAEEGIAVRWTASVRDAVDTAKGLKSRL